MGEVRFGGGGQFVPTLVIGLGGSGINTARRVKRIQEERYGRMGILKYLFADTDQGAYAAAAGQAQVGPDEQASVITRNASRIYQEVQEGLRPEIAAFLPDTVNVSILEHADGAGGIRPAGRFAFFSHLHHFYHERLEPTCGSLMQIRALVDTALAGVAAGIDIQYGEPRVYILNSICGGTGSSAFLDVALLTRHAFQQHGVDPSIIGVFFLPSVFRNERGIGFAFRETILANGCAGLMELEYFCDPSIGNDQWSFSYPDVGTIPVTRPVFDECYLIEGLNARGQQLETKQEVFEMAARSICVDIGSPVGARARSARRNTMAVLDTNPCRETGKFRLVNSLATAGLRVPIYEIARFGSLHTAREIISSIFVGAAPSLDRLEEELSAFLSSNRLEERGEQDQLIERLLADPDGELLGFRLGRTRQELEEEAVSLGKRGEKGQVQYVAAWIQQKLEALRTRELPDLRTTASRNKAAVLQSASDAVRKQMLEYARTGGLAYARSFLAELSTVLQIVVEELANESAQQESSTKSARDEIDRLREELLKYGSLMDLVFRPDDDERAMDAALQLLQRIGSAEYTRIGREAALDVLNSQQPLHGQLALLPQVNAWLQLVTAAIDSLGRADRVIATELDRRMGPAQTGSTYVLDQQLVKPSQYIDYCRGAGLNHRQLGHQLWDRWAAAGPDGLGAIQQIVAYQKSPEQLIDQVAREGADELMHHLEQHASIMAVIQQRKDARETDAQYLQRQIQLMFSTAEPFWSTTAPRGMGSYERYVAVTVPCRTADPQAAQIRDALTQQITAAGAMPEMVEADYPFALEISTRAYGARAYYLRTVADMARKYEAKLEMALVREFLHIDKRFLDGRGPGSIPTLHPQADGLARLLFAWSIAYGYIAKRGERYYVSVTERTTAGKRIPTTKYRTDWKPAIADLLDSAWKGMPQASADPKDQIAQGRAQAMVSFCGNAGFVQRLLDLPDRYSSHWGAERACSELGTYLERLEQLISETTSDSLRMQYAAERDLLEQYVQRLRGLA